MTRATYTGSGSGISGRGGDHALSFSGTAVMNVLDAAKGAFASAVAHDAITVSLWIKGGMAQPAQDSVFWAGSNTDGSGTRSLNVHLPWSDSVIYWDTGCCDPSLHRISVSEPDSTKWKGVWNHYAFVKSGTMKQIWENGRLLLEGQNQEKLAPIRSLFVGAGTSTGNSGYHGLIDEVSLWDLALKPAQIGALAAGASPLDLRELQPFIDTEISSQMRNQNASAWLRVPFQIADPLAFDSLTLRLRYNDGFVAYLNGVPIAQRNAPSTPAYDAVATAERPPGAAIEPEYFDLGSAGLLKVGINVLALHGLNRHATNATFLLQPELLGGREQRDRVFVEPTPGGPNGAGYAGLVAMVTFSVDHGLFETPFALTLVSPTPETSLAYTVDGSEPSSTRGVIIPGPSVTLQVSATTVVRAVGIRDDFAPAEINTRSYIFPGDVAAQKRPADLPASWPGGHPTDFAIDSRVVNGAKPGYGFRDALTSIPTLSIVTPRPGLFGAANGIYLNSGTHGDAWERPASVEWIRPDGRPGFQHNAGLRIHGGISRDKGFTPKHGFSTRFRSRYGTAKLDYALFSDPSLIGFDQLTLRAGSTDTWPCVEWDSLVDGQKRWYRKDSSYVRDQWVRDSQIALGWPSGHGAYAHLYLNGLYWGLYNVCERPDDAFAALHFGGDREEYDVLADFAELHAGNADAWNRLMSLAGTDLTSNANYFRLLGQNSNGTRNPNMEVLLDVDNLIDYMILHIYITADDWPVHNWWASRRRGPLSTGFKFFAWDQEISNNSVVKQHNSSGQFITDVDLPNTPAYVYARCRLNPEFRLRFADRVQKHLFHGGALTSSNALARWNARIGEIDQAVVAESARWGDYQRPSKPYLREVEWLTNRNWMRQVYFPTNTLIALRRFRNANLFPATGVPTANQLGGLVTNGFQLVLNPTGAASTLYYTTDGLDPRRVGGAIGVTAKIYDGPIPVTAHSLIRARVRNGSSWSPLLEAEFFVPTDYSALQPTEIHYHPPDAGGIDGDGFEFVELTNLGTRTLDLAGLRFTAGIDFQFPENTPLAPGGVFLLAANSFNFAFQFRGVRVDGVYQGRLANSGDTLTLHHDAGFDLFSFAYQDSAPWPVAADGAGASLQRLGFHLSPGDSTAWLAGVPTPGVAPDFSAYDSDGDQMPDAWEKQFGTDPHQPDPESDLDGDGLSNVAEYFAGTDPGDPGSRPLVRISRAPGGQVDLSFTAVSNRTHEVHRRMALDGPWELWKRFESSPTAAEVHVMDSATDTDTRWYRLFIRP